MKKIFNNIVYSLFALVIIGLVILFIAPPLPGVGSLDVKIVKSGSMEPSIMTGAVVVVQEASDYKVGDVITFTEKRAKIPTTHRIVGTEMVDGENHFVTKGDSNEERDGNLVAPSNIIGKVALDVPYAGFVLDFARQPLGFGLLIGIPALLIILDELIKIWCEARRFKKLRVSKKKIAPVVVTPYDTHRSSSIDFNSTETKTSSIKAVSKRKSSTGGGKAKDKAKSSLLVRDIQPRLSSTVTGILLFVFVMGQIHGGGAVLAYPTDVERSSDNFMQSQGVDLAVNTTRDSFEVSQDGFVGENTTVITLSSNNPEAMVYDVSVEESVTGASTFCSLLKVEVEAPVTYQGDPRDITREAAKTDEVWQLSFSLAPGAVNGTCLLDFTFTGYLSGTANDSGYVDTEMVQLQFEATQPTVVQDSALQTIENTQPLLVSEQENELPNEGVEDNSGESESETETESESEPEEVPSTEENQESEPVLDEPATDKKENDDLSGGSEGDEKEPTEEDLPENTAKPSEAENKEEVVEEDTETEGETDSINENLPENDGGEDEGVNEAEVVASEGAEDSEGGGEDNENSQAGESESQKNDNTDQTKEETPVSETEIKKEDQKPEEEGESNESN